MTATRHPYRLTTEHRLARAGLTRHVADLVRLVLLTGPRERLHRSDFGGGLGPATIFEPLHEGLAAVVELRVKGSLEDALGDRIDVLSVHVERVGESELDAAVSYRLRPDGKPETVGVPIRA